MTTTPHVIRASALAYAQKYGWYVFPIHNPIFDATGHCTGCTCEHYRRSDECKRNHPHLYLAPGKKCANPGKCPRVRWSEKSTTDTAMIERWFGKPWRDVDIETGAIVYNMPNFGIDCGKSGILTFDADTYKNTCGDIGDLLSMADRQTVTSLTGGGGEHLIYASQGKPYGNSTRGLPPGIDIRGVGGYIVAPPSLHKSNRRYQFEDGYGPRDVPLLPIPSALEAILGSATPTHRADVGPSDIDAVNRATKLVEAVLERAELDHYGREEYGNGRRWVLQTCPFNPADDQHASDKSAFVLVLQDGKISAGCHHNRCQKRIEAAASGWQLLKTIAGIPQRRRVLIEVTL